MGDEYAAPFDQYCNFAGAQCSRTEVDTNVMCLMEFISLTRN